MRRGARREIAGHLDALGFEVVHSARPKVIRPKVIKPEEPKVITPAWTPPTPPPAVHPHSSTITKDEKEPWQPEWKEPKKDEEGRQALEGYEEGHQGRLEM